MAICGLKDTLLAMNGTDNTLLTGEETSITKEDSGASLVYKNSVNTADNEEDGEDGNADEKDNNEADGTLVAPNERTLSPLEQLIPAFMIYLLEFMDLPTRIKLAAGSTALSRLIYQQCTALWITIELSIFSLEVRDLITDDILAALLRRVNAWNTTKILILNRCYSIRGSGLEPLRNSRVLERAFIDVWSNFSIAPFIDILRTMLPHKLTEVKLPRISHDHNEFAAREGFHFEVRQTVHERAIDRNMKCSACHHPVRNVLHQIVPDHFGLPSTRCFSCLKHLCRTSTCPVELRDCTMCGVASCGECNKVQRCDGCNDTQCSECGSFSGECIYCNQKFCFDTCEGYGSTCSLCKKTVCSGCSQTMLMNQFTFVMAVKKLTALTAVSA